MRALVCIARTFLPPWFRTLTRQKVSSGCRTSSPLQVNLEKARANAKSATAAELKKKKTNLAYHLRSTGEGEHKGVRGQSRDELLERYLIIEGRAGSKDVTAGNGFTKSNATNIDVSRWNAYKMDKDIYQHVWITFRKNEIISKF